MDWGVYLSGEVVTTISDKEKFQIQFQKDRIIIYESSFDGRRENFYPVYLKNYDIQTRNILLSRSSMYIPCRHITYNIILKYPKYIYIKSLMNELKADKICR